MSKHSKQKPLRRDLRRLFRGMDFVSRHTAVKRELRFNTDRQDFRPVDDEDWINGTVFLLLPDTYPARAFASRLAEATKRN